MAIDRPDIDIDKDDVGGFYAYLRNGTEDRTTLYHASDYIFKNFNQGPGSITLDAVLYPLVKIDGKYYKNDGAMGRFDDANHSASMMNKNHTYLWGRKVAPVSLFNILEIPTGDDDDKYKHVGSTEISIFGNRETVSLRNFKIENRDLVSGTRSTIRQLYGDNPGFYDSRDKSANELAISKYFNFDSRELICHNFYARAADGVDMTVDNNQFSCNGKTYDLNLYQIVLCYVPPLDKRFYVASNSRKSTFKYKNKKITMKAQNKDGGMEGLLHDYYGCIENEEELKYDKPKVYYLNKSESKKGKNLGWGEVNSTEGEDIIELSDMTLVSGLPSYADQLIEELQISDQTSPMLWEQRFTNYNEVIATSYYDFQLHLKNVPILKYNNKHTSQLGTDDVGKVGNGGYEQDGILGYGTRETFCWGLHPYGSVSGDGPLVDLYSQTIYRNKQACGTDIQYSGFDDSVSRFEQGYLQINLSNTTREEGFFVVYAQKKGL